MGEGMMINRAPPLQSPCNPMGAAEQQPGDIPLPTYSHGLGRELQPPFQLCLAAVRGGVLPCSGDGRRKEGERLLPEEIDTP